MPPTRCPEGTVLDCATSSRLRAATRNDHLASEAAVDLGSLRTPAALAVLLRGWASVWQSVLGAAHAPSACSTAREELGSPAEQALDLLGSDLSDLAVLTCSGVTSGPGGSAPAALLDPGASGGDPNGRFAELLEVPSSSWGVAYVLRGSRLGGAVLAPVVSDAVRLPAGVGTSFLRSAGTHPGREWVAFRRRLDSLEFTPERLAGAVAAARWTFARVGAELSAHRREPQEIAR